jgi:flagellar biosynthesis chaperone FliJ
MHELEIEALREKNGEYSELIDVIREYNVELERQKKIEAVQEGFDFTGAEKDLAEKIAQGINNDNRTNSVFKDITTSVNEILPIIQSVTNDVKQGVIEAGDASDEIMNRIGEHFAVTASEVKESLQATEEAASTFGEFWDWIWGSTFTGKLDKYLDKVYDFAGQIYNVNKDYTSALKKETQQYFDDYDRMVDEWNDAWGDAHSEEEERIRRGKEKLKEIAEELNLNIDWDKELNAVGFKETADRMFKFGVKNALISALEDLQKRLSSNVLIRQVQVIIDKLKGEAANFAADPSFEAVRNNLQKFVDDNNVTGENLKKLSKQLLMEQGESMDKYASRLNNLRKAAKSFNDTYLQIAKTNAQLAAQNKAEYEYNLLLIKAIDSQIGAEQKKTSGTKQTENLNAQISLLKELNSEYNKLLKNYDAETAKMKIMASYTDAVAASFKAINKKYKTNFSIADIDFTSEEGMAASLAKLREVAAKMGDDAKAALEKAISPFVAEVEVRPIVKDRETFKKTMDDVIDDYNKTLEASNLGISTNLAERLFGIGGTGLQDLRFALENYANEYLRNADGSFKGEEGQKEYEKWLEKINDMEDKAVQERMKKYVKYLNQSYTEVAAARAKLMQQFLEIDSLDVEDSVKKQMKEGAKRESDEAVGKAMWNEFKDSGMYVELFNNLENASNQAIDAMIERLKGLGDQMKNLDPSQLKAIYEQIEKLEKVKMERGSLGALFDYASQAREMRGRGRTEDVVDTELAAARERELQIQQQITDNQLLAKAAQTGQLNVLAEQLGIQNEVAAIVEKYGGDSNLIAQYYTDQANAQQKSLQETKLQVNELQKEKGVFNNLRKSSKQFASDWKSVSNTMKSSWNEAFDVFEAVGGELNNERKAYKEVGNAILDVIAIIPTYVAGMTAAGVAINSAMGIIGLIAEAISLTMGLIKALAGMNDAKQQDKIDDLSKKVRQLEQDFEDLEEAMEHAMNSTDYLKSYEDALDNIDERIQKTREMADAERAKKDTDEEKLQEYADNVRDLEKEREELKQKLIEDWGGLGRDNWRSMAEDFVSAWMDAFEETGDGLEGLEKKFDEWLKNWFQKQATMKVASAMLEPLFTMIDEMTDKDHGLGLDTNEMEQIRQKAAEIFPQLNESLKEMWEAFDMGGGAVDSLTGLQQGIEGITEATAEVIEGYLNSIRYFVAEDNAILIQIRDSIVGGVAGSGIADNVASMRNLLEQINNKLPDMTPFANQGGVMGLNVRIVE